MRIRSYIYTYLWTLIVLLGLSGFVLCYKGVTSLHSYPPLVARVLQPRERHATLGLKK